jgi:predicted nucleic acid-binding Zn ribbon protein
VTKRRLNGPRGLNELMNATLSSARLARGVQKAQAILAWPQAVGADLARITRPRSQQGGTLFVEVRDSATAHHLSMQRHHLLKALNALLKDQPVTEIRFSVGSIQAPPDAPRAAPLPAPDRARARKLVQDVQDPELKQAALRAAEAITRARKWREEQGWRPCPVCGEPSKEQPCRACALTLEDPNVRRAARVVMRAPHRLTEYADSLGDSGMNAARFLALRDLAEQLDVLAVECVRSGHEDAYRAFLAEQATLYLALHGRKPRAAVTRADRAALPERVQQVLSAGR